MIKTTSLDSSMLRSCQYDTDTQQLSITFKGSGKTYRSSSPVPGMVYVGLIDASSAGQYYNANIKGKYGMAPDTGAAA